MEGVRLVKIHIHSKATTVHGEGTQPVSVRARSDRRERGKQRLRGSQRGKHIYQLSRGSLKYTKIRVGKALKDRKHVQKGRINFFTCSLSTCSGKTGKHGDRDLGTSLPLLIHVSSYLASHRLVYDQCKPKGDTGGVGVRRHANLQIKNLLIITSNRLPRPRST